MLRSSFVPERRQKYTMRRFIFVFLTKLSRRLKVWRENLKARVHLGDIDRNGSILFKSDPTECGGWI